MAGLDAVCYVAAFTGVTVLLWGLHVRVKLLETLSARDKAFLDEWRGHAGAGLDGMLLLAKNHEARIAALEAAERARKELTK